MLLIILLAELILLILFFVYTDEVSNNAKQDLKEGLVLYNTDNNAGLKDAWNAIQGEVCVCVSPCLCVAPRFRRRAHFGFNARFFLVVSPLSGGAAA